MVVRRKSGSAGNTRARSTAVGTAVAHPHGTGAHDYFASLNGHRPAQLYNLVLREVEEPLLKAVLDYAEGNQVRAAGILGINRGTLRKKLQAVRPSAG